MVLQTKEETKLHHTKTNDNYNNCSKYSGIKYKRMGKYVTQVFSKLCYKFVEEFDLASDVAWSNNWKVK